MSNRQIAIFDIDNCLADDNWRLRFIDRTKTDNDDIYRAYHEHAPDDFASNTHVVQMWLMNDAEIVMVTSRPEWMRERTLAWLRVNNIPCDRLLMRPNDDHRKSSVLKPDLVFKNMKIDNIAIAYDDRYDVLAAYNLMGIKTHMLSIHPQVDAE